MAIIFPDTTGLGVFDAALVYATSGIPVAPFDPSKGKGKSCGNLVGGNQLWYECVTTDKTQLRAWRCQFGDFRALATSPGAIGCVVLDVDEPDKFPRKYRSYLDSQAVPYVNTKPNKHRRRGHYWFQLPDGIELGNPSFEWGEIRSYGGGIVLPPYPNDGRKTIVSGPINLIPIELLSYLKAEAGVVGSAGSHRTVDLQQFCDLYADASRPHKIAALRKLHAKLTTYRSAHDAMREALQVGLSEAVIGYVPAGEVISSLRALWPEDRSTAEFWRLAQWAANAASSANVDLLKLKSDRLKGTDSREYAESFRHSKEIN